MLFRKSECYESNGTCRRQLTYSIASKLSSGAIAGIAIVAVIAAICAGAAFFFYRRWKAAMATQHDLYRAYTLQGRFPGSATAAPTGISSSLETRSNANLLRNDATAQAFSGRAPQLDGATPIVTGSRDSRSIIDTVSSPTQSAMDEVCPFRLVQYSKGVECAYACRVWDGGCCQKHPEEACQCPTNFQDMRMRDALKA